MTTYAETMKKNRAEILRLIDAKGLRLQKLPSGHVRVSGPGVDIHVTDLAYLNSFDLLPATR